MKADIEKLESLLRKMDLPFNRKKDLTPQKIKWLSKNLQVKNETHKNYSQAIEIIERLL